MLVMSIISGIYNIYTKKRKKFEKINKELYVRLNDDKIKPELEKRIKKPNKFYMQ